MTNRERAVRILHGESADRMPAVHFGYWNELLQEWAAAGHITREEAASWGDGNEADFAINRRIGWDFNWLRTVTTAHTLCPGFEAKVLEVLQDGTERFVNGDGLIQRRRPGIVSIPSEDGTLLTDAAAFTELYLPKLQYFPGRLDGFRERYEAARKIDSPLGLHLGSLMGYIRNWMSVVGMSYMLYDDPKLFGAIVDASANLEYECAKAVLEAGYTFDYAHFWEDICFKNGPLLSPDAFEQYCGAHYRRFGKLCRDHGIDLISLDCDGVTEKLLPTWFAGGVNVMFPIEIGVWGDQFAPARRRFGTGMLGVGGMDKTAFRKDKAAVDAELSRLRRLVSLGGFIPCPDHRLMPGSRFELVQYYAEEVKKIPTVAGMKEE